MHMHYVHTNGGFNLLKDDLGVTFEMWPVLVERIKWNVVFDLCE